MMVQVKYVVSVTIMNSDINSYSIQNVSDVYRISFSSQMISSNSPMNYLITRIKRLWTQVVCDLNSGNHLQEK